MSPKKGFTLIELLGVFTLLAIILLLSIPSVTGTLKKQRENTYAKFLNDLFLATEAYVQMNTEYSLDLQNQKVYIQIKDIVESDYLKSTTVDPNTNEKVNPDHYIEITVDENQIPHYVYVETKPELVLTEPVYALSTSDWTNQNVDVQISYGMEGSRLFQTTVEVTSNIEAIKCQKLENGEYSCKGVATKNIEPGSWYKVGGMPILTFQENGSVIAQAVDGTNYKQASSLSIENIDKVNPGEPAITYNSGANTDTWKNNYNIGVVSSDNVGIAYYQIDTDGDGNPETNLDADIAHNGWVPGNWHSSTTRFRAVDFAGNVSGWTENQHIHMDVDAPAVPTITYNGGANTCTWKNNYNLTLSATDNVAISKYEIDTNGDGTVDATTGSSFIPTNGHHSHKVRFRAVDRAGNRSEWTSEQHIHMDTSAPGVPTITYNSGANTDTWKNNYNLTLSATDNIGIATYQIDVDNNGTVDGTTGSNFIPPNGYSTCTWRVRAVDHAGNVSGWTAVQHIHMDTQKPTHTNWWWGEVTKDVARLYIQASDNVGIAKVQCPTSTATGGYNNWLWFNGVWDASANAYRCDITPASFGHYNQTYQTHLYLYDHANNGGYYNATTVAIPATCPYNVGQTWDFGYTGGTQGFSVPCSGTYKLEVWGAQGGNSSVGNAVGGQGGYAYGNAALTKDSPLYIVVGGAGSASSSSHNQTVAGGYNGGGRGATWTSYYRTWYGAGGGGATHIGTFNSTLAAHGSTSGLYIVAGGGGGAVYDGGGKGCTSNTCPDATATGYNGGTGGGTTGGNGLGDATFAGAGGSQSPHTSASYSQLGTFGQGAITSTTYTAGSGGGGGGLYGGNNGYAYGGGGGGSGYIGGVTGGSMSNGAQPGNGYARITLVSIN